MNRNSLTLISFIFFSAFLACEGKDEPSEFDRKPILLNLSDSLIIHSYEAVIEKVNAFDAVMLKFKASPSQADLELLQEAWLNLALSWKTAEAFNFGPIQDLLIASTIDYIPVDTSSIIVAVAAYKGQQEYLLSQGSNKKGIAAIEYIVYEKAGDLLIKNDNERYVAYLSLLSDDIKVKMQQVLAAWTDGYRQEFVNSTGDAAGSALTLVSNQMVFLVERVKYLKLGGPMAKTDLSTSSPDKVEAPYSHASLQLLKQNVQALKIIFNGSEGIGLDDYLQSLNIKDATGLLLSEKINSQFDAVIAKIDALDTDLQQAIKNKEPQLDGLYLEVLNLSILLKSDMMSQLGFLMVFSDNDGD
jgi:predicted lipoprotein